jgi:DNA-binding CsgD family transcriptional regulator
VKVDGYSAARLAYRESHREREVVTHVAAGRTNDEIARILFLSPTTAKTNVSRAMTKLGADPGRGQRRAPDRGGNEEQGRAAG